MTPGIGANLPVGAAVPHGRYVTTRSLQFEETGLSRVARVLGGVLCWPLALPAALLARLLGDLAFRTFAELFAGVPYVVGIVLRAEFYRFALRACGRNLVVEYGAVFCYRDVSVGSNVLLGRYCVVHHCDIGSYVLAGERCTFLSGSRQHGTARRDIPMALQPGQKKRISLADDCWIGSHSVVMEDVGTGAIVGAGSVITRPVPAWSVAAGNPARVLRQRDSDG